MQVQLNYSLDHLTDLTQFVHQKYVARVAGQLGLEVYEGQNIPGQHWKCYRSRAYDETDRDKNLAHRLTEMLTPSTTPADLEVIPKRRNKKYCPYLRLAQKKMS